MTAADHPTTQLCSSPNPATHEACTTQTLAERLFAALKCTCGPRRDEIEEILASAAAAGTLPKLLAATDYDGLSALALAAEKGDSQLVQQLISAGADVHAATPTGGKTPLHLAAQAGSVGAVQALLEAGASPGARTASDTTALALAAIRGHAAVVEAICEHMQAVAGPLPFWVTTVGFQAGFVDAVFLAIQRGRPGVICVLLDAGLHPVNTSFSHNIPMLPVLNVLELAAAIGSAAVIDALLQHPISTDMSAQALLDAAWEGAAFAAKPTALEGTAAAWRADKPGVPGLGEALTLPERLQVVSLLLQAAIERSHATSVFGVITAEPTSDARQGTWHTPAARRLLYTAFSQLMLSMQDSLEGELRSQRSLLQQLGTTVAANRAGLLGSCEPSSSLQAAGVQPAAQVVGSTGSNRADAKRGRDSTGWVRGLGAVVLLPVLAFFEAGALALSMAAALALFLAAGLAVVTTVLVKAGLGAITWLRPPVQHGVAANLGVAGRTEALTMQQRAEVASRVLQATVERSGAASVFENITAEPTSDARQRGWWYTPVARRLLCASFSRLMLSMQDSLEGELRSQQTLLQQLGIAVAVNMAELPESSQQATEPQADAAAA